MRSTLLLAWIGHSDLRAARGELGEGWGQTAQAVRARSFSEVHVLSDHEPRSASLYAKWLRELTGAHIQVHPAKLSGPTQFGEIYEAARSVIDSVLAKGGAARVELTYHLS